MEPKVVTLNINDILPNRFQPRIAFNEDKLNELSESIKKYGVIQPITVRQIGNKYEIIAGERRYKASLMAGLDKIPAIVQNFSDEISSEVALIENVQREDLTAIEEAISYKKILDMGMTTQEKLADKLGISQPAIANKLRLLQLSEEVQDALMENKISERHARSLLKLKNKVKQEEMLHRIINERLTVRKTDEEIKKILDDNSEEKVKDFIPSPEEIEILDIINSFKVNDKKEEDKVNSNDPMNQFNIPSVNIENDIRNDIPVSQPAPQEMVINSQTNIPNQTNLHSVNIDDNKPYEINSNLQNDNLGVNPGFMDIDKIQKEAIDIIPKEEVKNIDLLKSVDTSPNNQEIQGTQSPHGKFFDVMPSMQNRMEEKEKTEISSSLNRENNIFNNDSIFTNINLEPIPNSNVTSTTEMVSSNDNFSSFPKNETVDTIQASNVVLPTNNILVEKEPIKVPTESESMMGQNMSQPSIVSSVDNSLVREVPINVPIEPETTMNQNITQSSIVSPVNNIPVAEEQMKVPTESESMIGQNISQPSIVPSVDNSLVREVPISGPIEPETTMNQNITQSSIVSPVNNIPVVEEPINEVQSISNTQENNIPITPIIDNQSSQISETKNVQPIREPHLETINTEQLPKESEPIKNITRPLSFNMREGIQIVRNTVERLERLGHQVDSEEMDLQDRYEIKIVLFK